MTETITPYRSTIAIGRGGFTQLLRGEWTKFRSVRGWAIAAIVGAVLMVAFGALSGAGSHSTVATPSHPEGVVGHPFVPLGPGGEPVTDSFSFLHQPLTGDGSLTARISSLIGGSLRQANGEAAGSGSSGQGGQALTPGSVQPWAKVGLIIKAGTSQGSPYAAIMITGGHGVRLQDNYTGDIAGPAGPATSPRWLRLTRSGDTIIGYTSTDASTWTTVGSIHLKLADAVQVGLFATSPAQITLDQNFGGASVTGGPTFASATFDSVELQTRGSTGDWTGTVIDATGPMARRDPEAFRRNGDSFTVTGSGDIAPDATAGGNDIAHALVGGFAALTVMVVLAVLFISTEYRRGLIRTSLTISPRRGRVLAAKAVVIASVTFVTALVGAAIAVPISEHLLRVNGNFITPVTAVTTVRVVAGTAALLAVAAVLALAVGTILRRSAAAVAAAIVIVVLPYILGTAGVLPNGAAEWLLRVTPAAAFALQQTIPAYSQVDAVYTPPQGYFPMAPWAGFLVLCAWTTLALGMAAYLLRRRDA